MNSLYLLALGWAFLFWLAECTSDGKRGKSMALDHPEEVKVEKINERRKRVPKLVFA